MAEPTASGARYFRLPTPTPALAPYIREYRTLRGSAGMLRNLAEGLNTPRVPRWLSMTFIVAGPRLLFGLVHLSNPNGSLAATLGITLGGICFRRRYALLTLDTPLAHYRPRNTLPPSPSPSPAPVAD